MAGLTEEEFERWLTPQEVLLRLPQHLDWADGRAAIAERIKDGLIRTAAGIYAGKGRTLERFELAKDTWADLDTDDESQAFWTRGDCEKRVWDSTGYGNQISLRLYDVRLEPDGVKKLVRQVTPRPSPEALAKALRDYKPSTIHPAPIIDALGPNAAATLTAAIAPAQSPPPKHAGGRMPFSFWEDAILAVGYQIHLGSFKPKRPADVQRALADWISTQGYDEPGPTALKERAAKVFRTFSE